MIFCMLFPFFMLSQKPTQVGKDTSKVQVRSVSGPVRVAEGGLDSKLMYGALDSQWYDNKASEMHLYGNAFVEYEDKQLFADYIVLKMKKNVAFARKMPFQPNSSGARFIDAGKEYQYNSLKYNFDTEKGIVYDAISSEGEFLVHGSTTKYVGKKSNPFSDNDAIYNSKSLVTTCNHETPHFGIRAKKLKVVPEKLAVAGPSNMELAGIPTPVVIPFGLFPLTSGNSSGFIFPQDYEFNSRLKGFGLRGFGWYFPFNDYIHLQLTADVYTRGSFALYANTTYRKKYKYSGNIRLTFDNTITQDIETAQTLSQKGYSIIIAHDQDPKAHPFVTVGGSVNIVANNNIQRINNDARSVLDNTYRSNFYYRHSLPGTPFSLRAGLDHSQNTLTRQVNISFPDLSLNMNTIFPFKRKNRGSNDEAWYERITLKYDMKLRSFVQTTDTTLFTQEMYDDIKTGMSQDISTGFSTQIFNYLNFNANVGYNENWVLNTIRKDNFIGIDSTEERYDSIVTRNVGGFESFRDYNAGVSLTTSIFGTAAFSKGWLRGIRHTMKPTIGYSYAPDTRSRYTDTLELVDDRIQEYTIFENGPFNSPGFSRLTSQLNFGLNNVIEIKHFSKKDSTIKKTKLFDNITLNSNYNFAADSLKWGRLSINTTSRFFKGITVLSSNFTLDPYMEVNNRAVNTTVKSVRGDILRLERGFIKLSNTISVKQLSEIFSRKEVELEDDSDEREIFNDAPSRTNPLSRESQDREREPIGNKKAQLPSLVEIFESFRIQYELKYDFASDNNKINSMLTTHSLSFQGSIPLTENWNLNVGNIGYDFIRNGISYPAFGFSRKLHCWNMQFSWYPTRDTYSFFIGVSSGSLNFIKYNYGQNNVDGFFGRR